MLSLKLQVLDKRTRQTSRMKWHRPRMVNCIHLPQLFFCQILSHKSTIVGYPSESQLQALGEPLRMRTSPCELGFRLWWVSSHHCRLPLLNLSVENMFFLRDVLVLEICGRPNARTLARVELNAHLTTTSAIPIFLAQQ